MSVLHEPTDSRGDLLRFVEQAVFALGAVWIVFFLTHLTGCTSAAVSAAVGEQKKPKYELTLPGVIDGVSFSGIALGSAAPTHQITVSSGANINYFIGQTCHRFDKHQDVIEQGWIKDSKTWTYKFNMAPTLEDTGDCPLRICIYSKTVGASPVQCGMIDFKNPKYSLPFENICNGVDGATGGKALCHVKSGLVQRVRFREAVVVADPLPIPKNGDPDQTYLIKDQCEGHFIDSKNTLWEYVVPKDECYIVFAQLAKPHARAKLTVVPYDLPLYTGGSK